MTDRPKIHLVGLGPGDWRNLTLGAMETLRSVSPLVLRTAFHPTVDYLLQAGLSFETFDNLCEHGESSEAVQAAMADKLAALARRHGQVCFAVPGHPLVAEKESFTLIQHASSQGVSVVLSPGLGCVYPVDPLADVMTRLRAPNGCPWDRKQTHQSLRPYVIEEAYEVVEAIDQGDAHKVCEELGDLLLQIVFHSQIAQEAGGFDFNDIVQTITEKLIRRHPHVFADWQADTAEQVAVNWDKIKARERETKGEQTESLLQVVSKGLPGLMRALKLQAKAATVGFDWDDINGAWEKVHEELNELAEAAQQEEHQPREAELGDLLFAVVNLARFLKVDPEVAIFSTCEKFQRRFAYIESRARAQGLDLAQMTLAEMDAIWNEAKWAKM